MRTTPLLTVALLALAAVAIAPQASAIPPVCLEEEVEQGPLSAGYDQCRLGGHETMGCSNGSAQAIHVYRELATGLVWLQVHVCLPHSPPPLSAAASATPVPPVCGPDMLCQGPECPEQGVASDLDHHNEVRLGGDCSVAVQTGKGQICVGAWTGHETHTVGPVTWDRYYCDLPGGSPLPPLDWTGASQGPCTAVAGQGSDPSGPVGIRRDVDGGCAIDLYVKADVMDCLWGEGWNEGPSAGPVRLFSWGCRDFDPEQSRSSADPFPTCVRDCSPLPGQACAAQDATPAPLLHPVWGYDQDCRAEVATSCLGGSSGSTERRVGFVELSMAHC